LDVTEDPAEVYEVSCARERQDLDVIHGYLSEAYWSRGVPRSTVARAIAHSVCVGIFQNGAQVAFARAVTDYATIAYVADVFVLEAHRGRGLGKLLISTLRGHPDLQGLRTWLLLTRDAHGLYRQFGFTDPPDPRRVMMLRDAELYARRAQPG
jgi:GNAT superfamily N-acetyltransferase